MFAGHKHLLPYIEDKDLKDDRHHPPYRLGTYSVMSSRQWNLTRVTVRKLCQTATDVQNPLISELDTLCKLTHPQILLLMGVCPTSSCKSLMLVFEHVQLGSLFFHLHERKKVPSLKSFVDILLQISDAVIFLHGRGYLHCGVTSHAVQLVSPNIAKLGQFEYTVQDTPQETQNHAYHLLSNKGWQSLYNWLSPEVLNGEPPTKGGDIYSLCCVIWELCTAQVPWKDLSADEIVEQVVAEKESLPLDISTMPVHLYHLMVQGLQHSQSERDLDLHEIRDMLHITRRDIERVDRCRSSGRRVSSQAPSNSHAYSSSHAPSRPAPTRSLSSSAIQRGVTMPTRHGHRYADYKKPGTIMKRKVLGENNPNIHHDKDSSDSSVDNNYNFVTNPAKRDFLRSQPPRHSLGRRSLTSLYRENNNSHSDGMDLSSGSSCRDLSGSCSSSISRASDSSGSAGIIRRSVDRSADSGIRTRQSSGPDGQQPSKTQFRFPETYRRPQRRPLSGYDGPSVERAEMNPDSLRPYRRSRSVPRVNQISPPVYQTAIKPASHSLARHASSCSVSTGSTQRLSSANSTPKISAASQPKLSTFSRGSVYRSSDGKSDKMSPRKCQSVDFDHLSMPNRENDQSMVYHTANEEEEKKMEEHNTDVPRVAPPIRTIFTRFKEAMDLRSGSTTTRKGSQKPATKPAKIGLPKSYLDLWFPRRKASSVVAEIEKQDPQKARGAEKEADAVNQNIGRRSSGNIGSKAETSTYQSALSSQLESSGFVTTRSRPPSFYRSTDQVATSTSGSPLYKTAADQVTELLRRSGTNLVLRQDSASDNGLNAVQQLDPQNRQANKTKQTGDASISKPSQVVKKARYCDRRPGGTSRFSDISNNLMDTNLSAVERQTARITNAGPQRAKLHSVEQVREQAELLARRASAASPDVEIWPQPQTSTPLPAGGAGQASRQEAFNTALEQAGQDTTDESSAATVETDIASRSSEIEGGFQPTGAATSTPLHGQPRDLSSFSRESIDTVITNGRVASPLSRGATPTFQSASAITVLSPADEYGPHSIIQTVPQNMSSGTIYGTPVSSPTAASNLWGRDNIKTVLKNPQQGDEAGTKKFSNVTFNSSIVEITASTVGSTSSHVTDQSTQYESMNVERRSGRAPGRLSTLSVSSQRSSISSRTSLETDDLYIDDELRPGHIDQHMQLITTDIVEEEDPLQAFPHYPIFDHTDRESVLSMEIPSTGPQSLRSECNTEEAEESHDDWTEDQASDDNEDTPQPSPARQGVVAGGVLSSGAPPLRCVDLVYHRRSALANTVS